MLCWPIRKGWFLEEDISIATHLRFVFILNEQSFTFRVMSLVVINGRYIFKKKKTLWRIDVEMQVNYMLMQIKWKKKYNTTQHGIGVYLGGKVNACIFHLCNRKVLYNICKYKSLHEINFIHNEHLDSVFIQQHMHTYNFPFPLAHS